ncbi:MAG: hypothetical protein M1816_007411 [Peltula sp. TS41687]|nr:MAG: hypothetical protein M1816_007411 [Peltula sp. TS41687]
MPDPVLTKKGERQSQELAKAFPYHDAVDMLVSSPLRRALQTTLMGFQPDVQRGLKVVALPDAQETSDLPCDTGSDVMALEKEFGKDGHVDFGLLSEGWQVKTGRNEPTPDAIEARAKAARQWLKSRPEKNIVLVTHGGFLHYFTEDWTDSNRLPGTGWENTEFRSYQFMDEGGDNASLAETQESSQRRRGTEKPLTNDEQLQLRVATEKAWENESQTQ